MLAAAAGEATQTFAVRQANFHDTPGIIRAEGPTGASRAIALALARTRIGKGLLDLAHRQFLADAREIGPVRGPAPAHHMATKTTAFKELLSGHTITHRLRVKRRGVPGANRAGQGTQLRIGQRKGRHATARPLTDSLAYLSLGARPQRTSIHQVGTTVRAGSRVAMTAGAQLAVGLGHGLGGGGAH